MQHHANDYRDGNLHHTREDSRRVLLEHRGDHQTKDGQHHRQCHEQGKQKQQPHAFIQQSSGDVADCLAVVAETDDQGTKVMHRTNEDGAEHHPKQRGHPPPHDGDGRADDWARAGDGGEVVPEDDRLAGGHIVDAVLQPFTGANRIGRKPEDLATQPTAVGVVGDDEANSGQQGNQECFHDNRGGTLPKKGSQSNATWRRIELTKKFEKTVVNRC